MPPVWIFITALSVAAGAFAFLLIVGMASAIKSLQSVKKFLSLKKQGVSIACFFGGCLYCA